MEVDDHRINADLLYGQEEVTADAGSPSESASGIRLLRPMATRRIEHEAKKIVMMSSKEIEARDRGQEQEVEDEEDEEDSAMFLPVVGHEDGMDIDVEKDEKVWDHSLPKTRGMVKIKREDGNIMDTMDIDEIAAGRVMENSEMGSPVKEAPESPDQKQKGVTTEVAGSTPRRKSLKRKPIAPDQEEVRLTEDLSYMLNLLGVQSEAVDEKTADASGDKADVEEEASTAKPRLHSNALDGHMLLFQFPPILPPLKSSNFTGAERPVKDEPDDDVVVLDKAGPKPRANIDLTKDSEGKIKAEDDDDDDDMKGEKGEDLPEGFKIPKEGGFVGNLVMRRSGKVQLIWGGTTFDLAPGTHSHFLSTAALLEEDDPDPSVDLKAAHVGTVYGMGRVEGKFVLAPRFAEEGDWTVDPRDLEIPVDEQD